MAALSLIAGFTLANAGPAEAGGVGPKDLSQAGWTCFQPPPEFNPYIHCAPPGQLERIVSGEARSGMFITFDTTDLDAEEAGILGTERMIRGDLLPRPALPNGPANVRVWVAVPKVRLGLLHLPHLRQPLVRPISATVQATGAANMLTGHPQPAQVRIESLRRNQ